MREARLEVCVNLAAYGIDAHGVPLLFHGVILAQARSVCLRSDALPTRHSFPDSGDLIPHDGGLTG